MTRSRSGTIASGAQSWRYAGRFACLTFAACLWAAGPARAAEDEPDQASSAAPLITLTGEYILDLVAVAQGSGTGARYVDLASLAADLDLETAAGWRGARLVAQGIAGTGQRPNDLAGTLQGINNSEVPHNRLKLYQLYLTQRLGEWPVTLSAGFIDLNEQF